MLHHFAGCHDALRAAHPMPVEIFAAQIEAVLLGEFPDARARMAAVIRACLSNDWNGIDTSGATVAPWNLANGQPALQANLDRSLQDHRLPSRGV
jgi:hypothetical protein